MTDTSGDNGSPGLAISGNPETYATYPEQELRHYISDQELGRLSEMHRDHVVEFFWGAIGLAIGGLWQCVAILDRARTSGQPSVDAMHAPIGLGDIGVIAIETAAVAAAIIFGVLWFRKGQGATNLVDEIRKRPKVSVVPATAPADPPPEPEPAQ